MQPKYQRVVIKISGEALAGGQPSGIDTATVLNICKVIRKCADAGVQIGVVVGGGNFWRGRSNPHMTRARADHIGMMATVMNALAFADGLEQTGLEARVQTALEIPSVAERFTRDSAIRHLQKGRVLVFGCGTGSPFFSTDTAATLRAAEIGADAMLKATTADGVYDSDPKKNPNAVKYDRISVTDVLRQGLGVMDATAAAMCRDTEIPIVVFNLNDPENIYRAVMGEPVGTLVNI